MQKVKYEVCAFESWDVADTVLMSRLAVYEVNQDVYNQHCEWCCHSVFKKDIDFETGLLAGLCARTMGEDQSHQRYLDALRVSV